MSGTAFVKQTLVGLTFVGLVIVANRAEAMSFSPCRGFQGDVPERPSFVIKYKRGTALAHGGVFIGKNTLLAYRTEPIDAYYMRLSVEARAGDRFKLDDQTRCSPGTLNATKSWDRRQTRTLVPSLRLGRHNSIEVTWPTTDVPSETRIDWAYSVGEMQRGLYQTDITENWLHAREAGSHTIYPDLKSEMVIVRLTRYWPDGTSSVWRGWAYLDEADELRVNQGLPTREEVVSFRAAHTCPRISVRTVPVNPNFYHYSGWDGVGWQATGFAETLDGVELPVRRAKNSTIGITAGEGQLFRFDRLPRPSCPVPLRASSDRSKDPVPGVVHFDVGRYSDSPRGWVLDLELGSWRWPTIEVRWSQTPGQLRKSSKVEQLSPSHVSFTNMHWESPINVPEDIERFYVQLTPIWQDGARAPAWTGVVRIDRESGHASVEGLSQTHTNKELSASPVTVITKRPSHGKILAEPHDSTPTWMASIGLGILAWFMTALVLRRKLLPSQVGQALDSYSLPQLAVVAGLLASVWAPPTLLLSGIALAVHSAIRRQ